MSKEYFEGASVDEDQRRDSERYWARLALVVAIVACVLYPLKKAFAEEVKPTMSVTDPSGNLVRITTEPCEGAPEWLGLFKAQMRYEGVDYLACWREAGGAVLVFDSSGDLTPLPATAFTKDESL